MLSTTWFHTFFVLSFCFCLRFDKVRMRSINSKLFDIRLSPTTSGSELNITPTYYEDDLYKILGLSLNASRAELRDAYWAIAFRTHPDKNDTPAAICEFRNASYAYKILGRNEKTRSDYDSKYRTKQYINNMAQLNRDIITPFAMDVAVPFINFTVHGIKSFALPFVRDAYKQSSAVLQAAYAATQIGNLEEEEKNISALDIITRAGNAAIKARLEQRIRSTKESIGNTANIQQLTANQLKIAVDKEKELRDLLLSVELIDERDRNMLLDITRNIERAKSLVENAQRLEKIKQDECAKYTASMTALMESAAQLSSSSVQEEEEISTLESAISIAREKNRKTLIKQTSLDISISAEKRTIEALQSAFKLAVSDTIASLESYKNIEKELETCKARAMQSSSSAIATSSAIEKQNTLKSSLQSRAIQLNAKKQSLENVLEDLQFEWKSNETKLLSEKNRMAQRKNIIGERNEETKNAQVLTEIAVIELSVKKGELEMALREHERYRLLLQEKLMEEEELQLDSITKTDEIFTVLNSGNSTENGNDKVVKEIDKEETSATAKSPTTPIPMKKKERYVYIPKEKVNIQKWAEKSQNFPTASGDYYDDFYTVR